ncbi:hypothetical protein CALCODRAFT_502735 [Calocera cornea HHB12733]|uniref:Uncharacterized protein n=1 Tax=Calocera cornea HHB12733 TaxID=1353952 RepID=A0A165D4U2_9BASI|nr:hypothetical protein CALCODRAFT_502735 [Calocera cornea HHB12733]
MLARRLITSLRPSSGPGPLSLSLRAPRASRTMTRPGGYATAAAEAGDRRAKLVFRKDWRKIPVELYPLGVVVAAAVVGATVAMTRVRASLPSSVGVPSFPPSLLTPDVCWGRCSDERP